MSLCATEFLSYAVSSGDGAGGRAEAFTADVTNEQDVIAMGRFDDCAR